MSEKILVNGPITQKIISSIIAKLAEKKDAGGHSIFIGQVRADDFGARRVKAIEYSAYESMVESEAGRIIRSLSEEFNDVKSIDILHSKGIVSAGDISLLVIVSAGHRHQATSACSKAVEMIKASLPVWKKEIYEDNSTEWKKNNPV
jgi:molybdopterin synthase catalytic subunit